MSQGGEAPCELPVCALDRIASPDGGANERSRVLPADAGGAAGAHRKGSARAPRAGPADRAPQREVAPHRCRRIPDEAAASALRSIAATPSSPRRRFPRPRSAPAARKPAPPKNSSTSASPPPAAATSSAPASSRPPPASPGARRGGRGGATTRGRSMGSRYAPRRVALISSIQARSRAVGPTKRCVPAPWRPS
jgi:hypothetical protein